MLQSTTCTSAWIQATLPVSAGGIGIRRAVQLSPSAFLAYAAGMRRFIYVMATIPYPAVEEAKLAWNGNLNLTSPVMIFHDVLRTALYMPIQNTVFFYKL